MSWYHDALMNFENFETLSVSNVTVLQQRYGKCSTVQEECCLGYAVCLLPTTADSKHILQGTQSALAQSYNATIPLPDISEANPTNMVKQLYESTEGWTYNHSMVMPNELQNFSMIVKRWMIVNVLYTCSLFIMAFVNNGWLFIHHTHRSALSADVWICITLSNIWSSLHML